jgi:cholesterol oxidase
LFFMESDHDFVIIGSGFGGSVSALRLAEKGYRVLVLEKGKRWAPEDFPRTNWDLKRWLWGPHLGLRGIFQMSFLKHVTVLHGVGVGGGSLVYANTLPVPKDLFFQAPSWGHLADWKRELEPHYATARRMLGAATNPRSFRGDDVLLQIARDMGRESQFHPTEVAIHFGEPGKRVKDPYFEGKGPDRVGCTHCGACMTGCRVGAKNSLDRNYLYLAERLGAEVRPETEVTAVRAQENGGYVIETRPSFGGGERRTIRASRVIFAGGVMGTLPLLLAMKDDPAGLPRLSDRLGDFIRTNSEALMGIVVPDKQANFAEGVAITSILHTDDHSHIEPVRYAPGSGFFRTLALPHASGPTLLSRIASVVRAALRHPLRLLKALFVRDFGRQTQILLYMRTLDGTLSLRLGRSARTGFMKGLVSRLDDPKSAPQASMPEATDLAHRFAEKTGGTVMSMATETVLGVPSTAHILGGCAMGRDAREGVINARHEVHGYEGLYVIDGSAMSANPGVNPSLTITALAERAMSMIPPKAA